MLCQPCILNENNHLHAPTAILYRILSSWVVFCKSSVTLHIADAVHVTANPYTSNSGDGRSGCSNSGLQIRSSSRMSRSFRTCSMSHGLDAFAFCWPCARPGFQPSAWPPQPSAWPPVRPVPPSAGPPVEPCGVRNTRRPKKPLNLWTIPRRSWLKCCPCCRECLLGTNQAAASGNTLSFLQHNLAWYCETSTETQNYNIRFIDIFLVFVLY